MSGGASTVHARDDVLDAPRGDSSSHLVADIFLATGERAARLRS
jgi:hypothetical protein